MRKLGTTFCRKKSPFGSNAIATDPATARADETMAGALNLYADVTIARQRLRFVGGISRNGHSRDAAERFTLAGQRPTTERDVQLGHARDAKGISRPDADSGD